MNDLDTELEQIDKRINRLEARLRQYGNPHTPLSKRRSTPAGNDDDEGNGDARTTEKPTAEIRPRARLAATAGADEVVEVTADCFPDHPDYPTEGGCGVTIQSHAALTRYQYRLAHRKVADCVDQLFDLNL